MEGAGKGVTREGGKKGWGERGDNAGDASEGRVSSLVFDRYGCESKHTLH